MRAPIAVCAAVIVVWILENTAFGQDSPGTRHDVSVVFFLAGVIAAVTLLVLLAVVLARRVRAGR